MNDRRFRLRPSSAASRGARDRVRYRSDASSGRGGGGRRRHHAQGRRRRRPVCRQRRRRRARAFPAGTRPGVLAGAGDLCRRREILRFPACAAVGARRSGPRPCPGCGSFLLRRRPAWGSSPGRGDAAPRGPGLRPRGAGPDACGRLAARPGGRGAAPRFVGLGFQPASLRAIGGGFFPGFPAPAVRFARGFTAGTSGSGAGRQTVRILPRRWNRRRVELAQIRLRSVSRLCARC